MIGEQCQCPARTFSFNSLPLYVARFVAASGCLISSLPGSTSPLILNLYLHSCFCLICTVHQLRMSATEVVSPTAAVSVDAVELLLLLPTPPHFNASDTATVAAGTAISTAATAVTIHRRRCHYRRATVLPLLLLLLSTSLTMFPLLAVSADVLPPTIDTAAPDAGGLPRPCLMSWRKSEE